MENQLRDDQRDEKEVQLSKKDKEKLEKVIVYRVIIKIRVIEIK